MPSMMSVRRATAAVLAGLALSVATGAVSTTTAASASTQSATWLCNVNQNTWVRQFPGFTAVLYTIPAGGGFRIDNGTPAFADGLWWWFGHGNGAGQGWVPDQNLTNCQ